MANLALYREYRPKTFEEVIGQEHIITTLKNQIKTNSLSHAYLFCGTRGTGKTSTAKIFAKAINCEQNRDGSPCLKCQTCINLANSSNLDVLEIDAASNNRVDEIRELRDKIKYPPVNGKYKVYIIDEVHMLTESAYNALLKTLEEPPKHAIFILCTTEAHKLPQTILSRCMKFDFRLVEIEKLKTLLRKIFDEKNIKYEEEALHLIAQRGEGSVRDTLSVADLCASFCGGLITYQKCQEALGVSSSEVMLSLADAIIENDSEKILVIIDKLSGQGKNFTILNKELIAHFKNLLVIKTVKDSKNFLMLPKDLYEKYFAQANKQSSSKLLSYMQKLSTVETTLKYSLSPRVLFEITLLELLDEKKTEFVNQNEDIFIQEKPADIKKNESLKNAKEMEVNKHDVIAEILKNLRENNHHLLLSVYQNFEDCEVCENKIIVTFIGENYKDILEKIDNIIIINDILIKYGLTIGYKFVSEAIKSSTIDLLKQKFENIEIK